MNHDKAKGLLEGELASVEQALTELGTRDARTGEWDADTEGADTTATEPDEVADRIEELEERQGEVEPLTARRGEIIQALEAIDAGTYGTCSECSEPIEEARLEANPAATTCTAHS